MSFCVYFHYFQQGGVMWVCRQLVWNFSGCDYLWNVSMNYISQKEGPVLILNLTFSLPYPHTHIFTWLSSVAGHWLCNRWQCAVCASKWTFIGTPTCLRWINRTNSGVTWILYITIMCKRNNSLAWSHHLWTSLTKTFLASSVLHFGYFSVYFLHDHDHICVFFFDLFLFKILMHCWWKLLLCLGLFRIFCDSLYCLYINCKMPSQIQSAHANTHSYNHTYTLKCVPI